MPSNDPLLQVFFEEAAERLADSEAALVELESTPDDKTLLNRIFRCAHTLKSNSAMLGFLEIARFTHALEDLLGQLRNGRLAVTRPVVDTLLTAFDHLRALLAQVEAGNPTPSAEEAVTTRTIVDAVRVHLREEIASPPAAAIAVAEQPRTPQPPALPPPTDSGPSAAEVAETSAPTSQAPVGPRGEDLASAAPLAAGELPRRRASDREEASTLRVPIDRVDCLINLVGELVITQSMVSQAVTAFAPDKLALLKEAVVQMDRHARELHERMMALRMVPLRQLFGRLPRLMRDLTATVGKKVSLAITGEETELDKTVIEKISDPLTHLLRNAVDHGIESSRERLAAGKPETGQVTVDAYHQGGNIFIDVADDGRGLDRERILARAVQNGLAGADQVLTEDEVFAFIFSPGFSTADRVTEVSGRGVGMDVVKQNLEALGGSVSIRSAPGRGTCFRIKLPLTLAILDGQMVRVGNQDYLVPLLAILESVRPATGSTHAIAGAGEVIMVRGRALPLLRLHSLFGMEPTVMDFTQGLAVIVEHDGRQGALLVDEIRGQQQVVIKSLESNFEKVKGIAGATILGDGRVGLILDVPELIALAVSKSRAMAGQVVC